MKRFVKGSMLTAAAVAAALLIINTPAESQGKAKAEATQAKAKAKGKAKGKGRRGPEGPIPRRPDGTVDLSGIYNGGGPVGDIRQGLVEGDELPLLPAARAVLESRKAQDDPEANCLPTGVPRRDPYPWRIVQTDTHIFFLFEGNIHSYRQIFIDGRDFPPADELDPTWYGYSIGHWEGDTLVVETRGFNDKFWFDFQGHPHTEQMTTTERYTREDYGNLEIETTINDPGAYTKPFTIRFYARLTPGEDLMEYICQENNQDVAHIDGDASEF